MGGLPLQTDASISLFGSCIFVSFEILKALSKANTQGMNSVSVSPREWDQSKPVNVQLPLRPHRVR